jgi:hypothetical protein
MANYVGIVYTDDGKKYGWDSFSEDKKPQFYLKNDSQSPDLNIEDFDNEDVRNGLDEYRNGYPEPQGDVSITAHTKSAPTVLYGVMGNYIYTPQAITSESDPDKKLNVHEFWIGENLERPEWCGEFSYSDFFLKRIYGAIMDSMTWNATLDKTTVELGFIYQKEAVKDIYLEAYKDNFNLLKALPLVGYDYEIAIIDPEADEEAIIQDYSSQCFKELTITIENNHTTGEDARCLGSMYYGFKPTMESCNIEIEATTKFDRRNYTFIVGAMHNGYNPNSNRWNTLQVCKTFNKKVVLKARSCIDPDEYILFRFPKCRVTLDPIDGDSNVIEATLKLQPFTTEQVLLHDDETRKTTPMYAKVVTSAGRVAKDRYY